MWTNGIQGVLGKKAHTFMASFFQPECQDDSVGENRFFNKWCLSTWSQCVLPEWDISLARIWEGSTPTEKKIPPRVGSERGIGFPYLLQTIPFSVTCCGTCSPKPIPWFNEGLTSGNPYERSRALGESKVGELASWDVQPSWRCSGQELQELCSWKSLGV